MAVGTETNGHVRDGEWAGLDGLGEKERHESAPRCVAPAAGPIDGGSVHGDGERLAEDHVWCFALLGRKGDTKKKILFRP